MKISLIVVGKTTESYLKEGCDIFFKRLKHYTKLDYIEIPTNKKFNQLQPVERCKKEGEQILKLISNSDHLLLLDEKGKEFSSRKFANFIEQKSIQGVQNLVLVVGGAYGFSEEMYQRANGKISLSQMTFSHQMIRLFMVEQLYRAFTILKNEPYHND